MPIQPGKKENEQEFIARCVPAEIANGHPQAQAVAICYSKWSSRSKKEVDPNNTSWASDKKEV